MKRLKNFISAFLSVTILSATLTVLPVAQAEETGVFSKNIMTGDIDGNGIVDITDLTALSLALIGDKDLTEDQLKIADVDEDGAVTLADLARIQQYLSKKLESFVMFETLRAQRSESSEVQKYTAQELLNYIDYYASVNVITPMSELDKKFPIEQLYTPENASPYCIYQLDSGEKMYVFFDGNMFFINPVIAVFIVKDTLGFENFNGLETGMTLADVEAIDSGTKLMDTVKNHPLGRGNTLHMTKDGFVKITYTVGNFKNAPIPEDSEEFIIEKIEFIPSESDIEITFMDELRKFVFALPVNLED